DLVVRHVNKRRLKPLVQLEDLHAGLDPELGIEVRQRLVHEKDFRLTDDRPSQRDALPLAAGEGLGLAIQELAEAEDVGGLADALVDFSLRRLAQLEAKR